MKKYDAILIMGGGLTKQGKLPLWSKARFDLALKIKPRPKYYLTTSAGTVYKPHPLAKSGFPIYEAAAGAEYLVEHGVNPKKILIEKYSLDTIGNAFFSRLVFTENLGLKKLLIITNAFHMGRTKVIFNWIYNLAPLKQKYQPDFLIAPVRGLNGELLKQRYKKEKNGLYNLLKKKRQIKNLNQLAAWLFSEHSAYAYGVNAKKISKLLLTIY